MPHTRVRHGMAWYDILQPHPTAEEIVVGRLYAAPYCCCSSAPPSPSAPSAPSGPYCCRPSWSQIQYAPPPLVTLPLSYQLDGGTLLVVVADTSPDPRNAPARIERGVCWCALATADISVFSPHHVKSIKHALKTLPFCSCTCGPNNNNYYNE